MMLGKAILLLSLFSPQVFAGINSLNCSGDLDIIYFDNIFPENFFLKTVENVQIKIQFEDRVLNLSSNNEFLKSMRKMSICKTGETINFDDNDCKKITNIDYKGFSKLAFTEGEFNMGKKDLLIYSKIENYQIVKNNNFNQYKALNSKSLNAKFKCF
jgi:hypothetical protein